MADEELEVRAKLIADAGDFITPMHQAQAAVQQLQAALRPSQKMLYAAGAAAGAAGFALYKYGKAAFETAATVAELDVAIEAVGRSTGIGANKIREATEAIRKNGITMDAAQRIALTYARNNLDMAAASKVARVAQDLAVLSQKDSTQTAELLTRAIQTGSSILLKSAGISKYASEGYAVYARQLGKNANSLTAVERQQAMVNLVLTEGTKVAGVYEKSMTEPGKVLRSFKRLQSDMRLEFGKVLLEGFGPSIKALYDLTSAFSKSLREGGAFANLLKRLGDSARIMGQPFADAIGKLTLMVKNFDEGRVPAEKLQRAFDRLAPSVTAVSTGLAAMTGAKLLSLIGPFKGIASKISPVVTAFVVLTALSPKLREAFTRIVAAAQPLVPAFLSIATAIAEMVAAGAEIFAGLVEMLAYLAPALTAVAQGVADLAQNFEILRPVLGIVAMMIGAKLLKSVIATSIANKGFAFSFVNVFGAIKKFIVAIKMAAMENYRYYSSASQGGAAGAKLAAGLATLRGAAINLAVAMKGLMMSMLPLIAIFAAFKIYEMFTRASKEAKERTNELSVAIKDQIYNFRGASKEIAAYATDLRGINDALNTTGEKADDIRLAMMDLNKPLGKTLEVFQSIRKDGAGALRELGAAAGVTEDSMQFVVDYATNKTNLNNVPAQFRAQAEALRTLNNEAKKVNLKQLIEDQVNQIRITDKLGDKAYKLTEEYLRNKGAIDGAIDTEQEWIAVNEKLATTLVKLQQKEEAKKKSSEDATKATKNHMEATWALINGLNTLKTKTDDGKVSMDAFAETMFGGYKDANQFTAAIDGMREGAFGLMKSLKETKGNTDAFRKAGLELYSQLTENGAKISELGGNTGDLANYYKSVIGQFYKAADGAGWQKEQVDSLLKSLGILQALDSITVQIDADIEGLKRQLYFATIQLQKFEELSGVYNKQRAENYARLIAELNSQITTLEKSRTAIKSNENTWNQWTDTSDAAKKAADKLEKQKEKLRKKIMEVAEKALAKATERMEEYADAMKGMTDAAKSAVYGSYSLTDAFTTAETAAEKANEPIRQLKQDLQDYANGVSDSLKETVSFSNALSGYEQVQQAITQANEDVASAQAKVNEEQALYQELVAKAETTVGRKARREAYEEAAKQLEKVTQAQTGLTDATNKANDAQKQQKSLLDRLREQYKSAVKFSGQLQELVAKGLTKEGVDQLLAMGAETGSKFATELLTGSADAIPEVNKMFKELGDESKKAGDTLGGAYFKIGDEVATDFFSALQQRANDASKFAETVKRLVALGLSPQNIRMVLEAGLEAGSKIAAAIEQGGVDTITQMNAMEASLRGQAENLGTYLNDTFYKAGYDLAKQIVEGMKDKIELLQEEIADATLGQLKGILARIKGEFDDMLKGLPIPAGTVAGTKPSGTTDTGGTSAGGADKTYIESVYENLASLGVPDPKAFTPLIEGYSVDAAFLMELARQAGNIAIPFAKGGIVTAPTLGMVGEAGPEAVIPLNRLGNMGQSTVINLTVNAGMGTDGKSVGDAIVNELRRWNRKNGAIPVQTV